MWTYKRYGIDCYIFVALVGIFFSPCVRALQILSPHKILTMITGWEKSC